MQEEVNTKVVCLCIQSMKLTANVLRAAMRKFVAAEERRKMEKRQQKQSAKNAKAREKARAAQKKKLEKQKPHGKQTLRQLTSQNFQLSEIEVTDKNIKSFDRTARKYAIDYSIRKDESTDPPRWLVFFKSNDVDVMTAAFKEYSRMELLKEEKKSVRKKLKEKQKEKQNEKSKEKSRNKQKQRVKVKQKDRGIQR